MPTSDNPLARAEFVAAAHRLDQLPPDVGAEVAFAGRSNAGKSSAINALAGQRGLARTSRTPGRTQQLVVFSLPERRRLVDLPGFGYAKVPARLRDHWRVAIDGYLHTRRSLRGLVLIADIRHAPTPFDRQMLAYCAGADLRCVVLLSKADKLSRAQTLARQGVLEHGLDAADRPLQTLVFSAATGTGVEAARAAVLALLD